MIVKDKYSAINLADKKKRTSNVEQILKNSTFARFESENVIYMFTSFGNLLRASILDSINRDN